MNGFVFAYPGPAFTAQWRQTPEDFNVEERLPFEPDGAGQHVWLTLRKTGLNTADVVRMLARLAKVAERDVGYVGLKDKHAVTTQSFSVDLAGKPEPAWAQLEGDGLRIVQVSRHGRKLKRGMPATNRFTLRLRNVEADPERLADRLVRIQQNGFPNYFGEQRFGMDGGNLVKAAALCTGIPVTRSPHLRGLYISAARSAIFNAVLQARVVHGSWYRILSGELVILAGSHSFFLAEDEDLPDLHRRAVEHDIFPSGPLCGHAKRLPDKEAFMLEDAAMRVWKGPAPFAEDGHAWQLALARLNVEADRRQLVALPKELTIEWERKVDALIHFVLPSGSYATSLLAELLHDKNLVKGEAAT